MHELQIARAPQAARRDTGLAARGQAQHDRDLPRMLGQKQLGLLKFFARKRRQAQIQPLPGLGQRLRPGHGRLARVLLALDGGDALLGQGGGRLDDELGRLVLARVDAAGDEHGLILLEVGAVLLQGAREDDELHHAGHVLDGRVGHHAARLGRLEPHGRHDAGQAHIHAVLVVGRVGVRRQVVGDLADAGGVRPGGQVLVGVHGVAGQVQTCRLLFQREQLFLAQLGQARHGDLLVMHLGHAHAEQVELALDVFAALGRHRVHHPLVHGQKLAAVEAHRVERARLDEALERAAAELLVIQPLAEVHERLVRPVLLALAGQAAHEGAADVLDGGQAKADVLARDRKAVLRAVDVGRQHADAHLLGLGDVLGHLARHVEHRGQKRRHILARIMAL